MCGGAESGQNPAGGLGERVLGLSDTLLNGYLLPSLSTHSPQPSGTLTYSLWMNSRLKAPGREKDCPGEKDSNWDNVKNPMSNGGILTPSLDLLPEGWPASEMRGLHSEVSESPPQRVLRETVSS